MKVAIITDLHFGCRKDDKLFRKKQLEWINNQFFPTIDKYNIESVINMGDTFDNRISINVETMNLFYEQFFQPLSKKVSSVYNIIGNHDAYYKDANKYSMMKIINDSFDNFMLVDNELVSINVGDRKVVLCPWINSEIHDNIIDNLNKQKDKDAYLMGHFQINGIPIVGGMCQRGLSQELFHGWKEVLSGHFHNPSSTNNIWYTGNPFFFTWSDIGLNKGFLIYDSDEDEFEHIGTEDVVYHSYKLDEMTDDLCSNLSEQIVRIEVDGLNKNKKKVKSVMNLLTDGNNIIDVVESNVDFNTDISFEREEVVSDINSEEFIDSIFEEDNMKKYEKSKDYMKSLMRMCNK